MIPFADDTEMRKIAPQAEEFLAKILYYERLAFISDEATIWDCSMDTSEEELIDRCSTFHGVPVTAADLKQPLWLLITQLNQARTKNFPHRSMATMTPPAPTATRTPGGAFLITSPIPDSCFFPERRKAKYGMATMCGSGMGTAGI